MLGFVLTRECDDPHSNVVLALVFWWGYFLVFASTFLVSFSLGAIGVLALVVHYS